MTDWRRCTRHGDPVWWATPDGAEHGCWVCGHAGAAVPCGPFVGSLVGSDTALTEAEWARIRARAIGAA